MEHTQGNSPITNVTPTTATPITTATPVSTTKPSTPILWLQSWINKLPLKQVLTMSGLLGSMIIAVGIWQKKLTLINFLSKPAPKFKKQNSLFSKSYADFLAQHNFETHLKKRPETFSKVYYGPGGTGKSYLAEYMVKHLGQYCHLINIPEYLYADNYVLKSKVSEIFKYKPFADQEYQTEIIHLNNHVDQLFRDLSNINMNWRLRLYTMSFTLCICAFPGIIGVGMAAIWKLYLLSVPFCIRSFSLFKLYLPAIKWLWSPKCIYIFVDGIDRLLRQNYKGMLEMFFKIHHMSYSAVRVHFFSSEKYSVQKFIAPLRLYKLCQFVAFDLGTKYRPKELDVNKANQLLEVLMYKGCKLKQEDAPLIDQLQQIMGRCAWDIRSSVSIMQQCKTKEELTEILTVEKDNDSQYKEDMAISSAGVAARNDSGEVHNIAPMRKFEIQLVKEYVHSISLEINKKIKPESNKKYSDSIKYNQQQLSIVQQKIALLEAHGVNVMKMTVQERKSYFNESRQVPILIAANLINENTTLWISDLHHYAFNEILYKQIKQKQKLEKEIKNLEQKAHKRDASINSGDISNKKELKAAGSRGEETSRRLQ